MAWSMIPLSWLALLNLLNDGEKSKPSSDERQFGDSEFAEAFWRVPYPLTCSVIYRLF